MSLLICTATAKELCGLAPELFPDPQNIKEMQPMAAQVKNGEAIFLVTGVGIINTALAIGFCLGLRHESITKSEKIDGVIYAGLAGAYDLNKNPLCSIWQVTEEIWPEYGLHDGTTVTARAFSFPLWTKENGEVIYERISLANITDIKEINIKKEDQWPQCKSITVAGVSASFDRREKLWNFWHAELENMEGFAAAYICARAEIPCIEIRAISNKVGPRSREEKDFDGSIKALGQILSTLNLI